MVLHCSPATKFYFLALPAVSSSVTDRNLQITNETPPDSAVALVNSQASMNTHIHTHTHIHIHTHTHTYT